MEQQHGALRVILPAVGNGRRDTNRPLHAGTRGHVLVRDFIDDLEIVWIACG